MIAKEEKEKGHKSNDEPIHAGTKSDTAMDSSVMDYNETYKPDTRMRIEYQPEERPICVFEVAYHPNTLLATEDEWVEIMRVEVGEVVDNLEWSGPL